MEYFDTEGIEYGTAKEEVIFIFIKDKLSVAYGLEAVNYQVVRFFFVLSS